MKKRPEKVTVTSAKIRVNKELIVDAQRLRNITTGILHTTMSDVKNDIGFIVGAQGVLTHQIPAALEALKPWLQDKVKDDRFWNNKYDPEHSGDFVVSPMTDMESTNFFDKLYQQ